MNSKQREEALTLEILEAIEEQNDVTQRHLARRTGVALGLANSYLKRCVRKGLVKMQQAPANRYLYYLTPKGFAEKSRLTAQYLSYSFTFYRRASDSCAAAFEAMGRSGARRVALCGASDLAEIATLRALEHDVEIVGVIDFAAQRSQLLDKTVVSSPAECAAFDACLLTDLIEPRATYRRLSQSVPAAQIVIPAILGLKPEH